MSETQTKQFEILLVPEDSPQCRLLVDETISLFLSYDHGRSSIRFEAALPEQTAPFSAAVLRKLCETNMILEPLSLLLKEAGSFAGIPDLSCDEHGYCCLSLSNDVYIHMRPKADSHCLLMYTEVCTLVDDQVDAVTASLLQWNMDGSMENGASLGLLKETIILCCDIHFKILDGRAFQSVLEGMTKNTEQIRSQIDQQLEQHRPNAWSPR